MAHQLLIKIHPTIKKLVFALAFMQKGQLPSQTSGKLYSWLRTRLASSKRGILRPAWVGEKISAAKKGKKLSEETKSKMRLSAKRGKDNPNFEGRFATPEWRAKHSAALIGRKRPPFSAETRARISAARIGWQPSSETRARMSAAHKGIPTKPCSPEKRIKIGNANRGRTGRTPTKEHQAKMLAGRRAKAEARKYQLIKCSNTGEINGN